ncbi:MAG: HAD family hydrolase [Crocinitomicaceae bacterium]
MKLFVFDIDDTLTRSEDQHICAYVQAMNHFGISEIDQNWASYEHHTDSFILKENYERNFPQRFDFNFIPNFEARMTELILDLSPVTEINGAQSIIRELNKHPDYAMCFATGSLLQPALIKLNQAEIDANEELVAGSNEIFEREGIVSEAIQRAKQHYAVTNFESIISIGDGIWDLKTAKNLGIHFIGIGMKNYADFQQAGINTHIEDWSNFDPFKV